MPPSADLIDQVLDQVVLQFQGITVGNGFHQTVQNIFRPPVGTEEMRATDCPAISLRIAESQSRFHIRGAEEVIIGILAVLSVAAPSQDNNDALFLFASDVRKVIYANPRWNNGLIDLADRTWVSQAAPHETEVSERMVSASILFHVLTRASQADLTARKVI